MRTSCEDCGEPILEGQYFFQKMTAIGPLPVHFFTSDCPGRDFVDGDFTDDGNEG